MLTVGENALVACQNNGDKAFLKQSQALHDKQIIGKHIKNCPKPYFHILQIFYTITRLCYYTTPVTSIFNKVISTRLIFQIVTNWYHQII